MKTKEDEGLREMYYHCAKHGDLSTPTSIGGLVLSPYLSEAICPHCFSEWLVRNFGVELRSRALDNHGHST